ncbi:MAG: type III-B CRISPR-associated protein Cas10/Cmr2, partial [Planctomycetota bacterium]
EQLYFEENLTKEYFQKYDLPIEKLEKLKEIRDKLEKKARKQGLSWPSYYGLVMLDGDSMGKWLSGEYLNNKSELESFHKNLSKSLGEYAEKVQEEIVKPPKGSLVYAGGDDVLAFLNLNYLLYILEELRANFPDFTQLASVKEGFSSSASCGVVLAHYKTPLSAVLREARRAEKKAKSFSQKDCLAMVAMKRSGEIVEAFLNWKESGNLKVLEKFIQFIKEDKLSSKFLKVLRSEFGRLIREELENHSPIEKEWIHIEIQRLILRSQKKGKEKELKDFSEELFLLYQNLSSGLKPKEDQGFSSLHNFLSLLEICEFLTRQ